MDGDSDCQCAPDALYKALEGGDCDDADPQVVGCTVYFADRNALKGTLTQSLREAQPTIFLGVPRVWEKIYEKMVEVGRQNKGLKQQIGGLVICKISGDNTGVAKRVSPGLEKFDSILSYQFYLTLPATLSQPGVLS